MPQDFGHLYMVFMVSAFRDHDAIAFGHCGTGKVRLFVNSELGPDPYSIPYVHVRSILSRLRQIIENGVQLTCNCSKHSSCMSKVELKVSMDISFTNSLK